MCLLGSFSLWSRVLPLKITSKLYLLLLLWTHGIMQPLFCYPSTSARMLSSFLWLSSSATNCRRLWSSFSMLLLFVIWQRVHQALYGHIMIMNFKSSIRWILCSLGMLFTHSSIFNYFLVMQHGSGWMAICHSSFLMPLAWASPLEYPRLRHLSYSNMAVQLTLTSSSVAS